MRSSITTLDLVGQCHLYPPLLLLSNLQITNPSHRSGAGMAGSQSIHANVYATQPIAKFGTPSQLHSYLPPLITGSSRACFGVTEPNTGLDTLKLKTIAKKASDGSSYYITGQKIWISSAQVASHMILLARTTPLSQVIKPSEGLSLFFIPLPPPSSPSPHLTLRNIPKMGAHAIDANEVFFDSYEIPVDSLIGDEGSGFKIVLHGMNAERCLLAGESLGLGYAALEKASRYARERSVFGRKIGMNQGIAHPLAECWMGLEAAKEVTFRAARMYDQSVRNGRGVSESAGEGGVKEEKITPQGVGVACNAAKFLAADAAFKACERAVLTLGGMGYAKEYHVERYLRECFIPRIAPVSREMVLNFVSEKVLGLPRSY